MKTITLDIDPQGLIKIETSGFVGTACAKATAEIEKALGTTTKSTKKAEYFAQPVKTGQQQKAGGS